MYKVLCRSTGEGTFISWGAGVCAEKTLSGLEVEHQWAPQSPFSIFRLNHLHCLRSPVSSVRWISGAEELFS